MSYLIVKWIHVMASTLLFGTGVGSAFYLLLASRRRDPAIAAFVARRVVLADWLFTATTVVVQPLSGAWLVAHAGFAWSSRWLATSLALYAIAVACWLPVVALQRRMRDVAEASVHSGEPLPPVFFRLSRWWIALGWPAFVAFLAIFWLMVAKPA